MKEIEARSHKVLDYFAARLEAYGETPQGVDWNSTQSQVVRFLQVLKICDFSSRFSLIDYGCGYGGMVDYLEELDAQFTYVGYDPLEKMIAAAQSRHAGRANCAFTARIEDLKPATFVVASGIFNVKLDIPDQDWTAHVIDTLDHMNRLSLKGFSFNCLTTYSDAERMRSDLYYADPGFLFHHCKTNYAKDVALLHDYSLFDFTILVRKDNA